MREKMKMRLMSAGSLHLPTNCMNSIAGMRKNQVPPQLIGNALMHTALIFYERIARPSERLPIYQAWATKVQVMMLIGHGCWADGTGFTGLKIPAFRHKPMMP